MLTKEQIMATLYGIRSYVRDSQLNVPNFLGIKDGFMERERIMVSLRERLGAGNYIDSPYKQHLEEIMLISEALPQPFWLGIHPTIALELLNNLDNPYSDYWHRPLRPTTKPTKSTRIIRTEPGINKDNVDEQVAFLHKYLPSGSLACVFVTHGNNSLWLNVPIANTFARDSHQMSLPATVEKRIGGFSMVQLTATDSMTAPHLWREDKDFSTKEWMNLHEAAHCLIIPTCWEYIDRSYGLLTPEELLKLTVERNRCLARWFMSYGMDVDTSPHDLQPISKQNYEPDSTSSLYEFPIIQRANFLAKNRPVKRASTLPEDLYWFRGFHLDQVCGDLEVDREEIIGAIIEMNNYWINNHYTTPSDPILNSVVHSTDIGTHPAEEVCIDILALTISGKLPQKLNYWESWTNKVLGAWKKWESNSTL